MRPRLVVAVVIMLVANVAAVYSMAANVAWGWHLLGLGLVFAALGWWARRDLATLGLAPVLLIAAAVQATGLLTFPLTSDDIYRYVWDGRVQLAGIDPYRYVPLDPALSWLRDSVLFPPGGRPMINRPTVPTIYPPGAQLWFTVVALLTPAGWALAALRVGAGLAVVGTTAILGRELRRPAALALIYGGNPLIMIEATNGGHLDALVGLAIAGLCWATVRGRHWLAGLLLGLAASIKLLPLLLIPIFIRRGRWRTSATAVAMVLAGYLPHVLVVGALVFGYLPGYLGEEGYDGSGRFALLSWLPPAIRLPVALVVAALLALLAFVRSAREPAPLTCVWLYGASFLVATPIYPWYAMPLLVLAVLTRRWEWIAVWAAAYVAFVFDHSLPIQAIGYGCAALVVVLAGLRRTSSSRKVSSVVSRSDLTV